MTFRISLIWCFVFAKYAFFGNIKHSLYFAVLTKFPAKRRKKPRWAAGAQLHPGTSWPGITTNTVWPDLAVSRQIGSFRKFVACKKLAHQNSKSRWFGRFGKFYLLKSLDFSSLTFSLVFGLEKLAWNLEKFQLKNHPFCNFRFFKNLLAF